MKKIIIAVLMIVLISTNVYAIAIKSHLQNTYFMEKLQLANFLHVELKTKKELDAHRKKELNHNVNKPLVKRHIEILDVGTGNGVFLNRVKKYFQELAFSATVTGIDNGDVIDSSTRGDASQDMKFDHFIEGTKAEPGVKLIFCDIFEFKKKYKSRKYDVVFVNAPQSTRHSMISIVEESMRFVRPSGMLFLRYHVFDEDEYQLKILSEMVAEHGYSIIKVQVYSDLPEGDHTLNRYTYVIKKHPFISDIKTIAKSLGNMEKKLVPNFNITIIKAFIDRITWASIMKKEIVRKQISILQLNAGNGSDLNYLKFYYENMDYDVTIVGLDDRELLAENLVSSRKKDDRVIFGDIFHPEQSIGDKKFDIVYAKYLADKDVDHTSTEVIAACLAALKDDGVLFFQFFIGKNGYNDIIEIYRVLNEHNCNVIVTQMRTPNNEEVEWKTFIVKKSQFVTSINVIIAHSLGQEQDKLNTLKKAA